MARLGIARAKKRLQSTQLYADNPILQAWLVSGTHVRLPT
jgi:hypothetical protein